jgi:hypothetical protein
MTKDAQSLNVQNISTHDLIQIESELERARTMMLRFVEYRNELMTLDGTGRDMISAVKGTDEYDRQVERVRHDLERVNTRYHNLQYL